MDAEELRAALEALPVEERKRLAAAVLSGTADPTRKAEHAREIGKLGGRPKGSRLSDEHRAAIAAKWAEKREQKQAAQSRQEKRKPGRPKKQETVEATAARPVGRPPKSKPEAPEKRPVGRPRKADTETAAETTEAAQTGA